MRLRVACIDFASPRDLTAFAEACLRFTPEIAIGGRAEDHRSVFLEIGKCRSLYGEETFRRRLQVLLQRFGGDAWAREARVSVARDATRALLGARYGIEGDGPLDDLPLEAFHELADPFHLTREKSKKPIDSMIHSLRGLGLRSIGDFFRLPRAELSPRFGAWSLQVRSQLDDSSLVPWPRWAPREIIEETIELAHDDYCTSLEPLLFQAKTALDRAYSRLQGRGLRCAALRIELKLEAYSTVKRPVRVFDFDFMMPQGTTRGTLPILQERWEREFERHPLEASVLRLRSTVTETTPGYQRQKQLFDERDDIQEAYHSVVAQLAESVGRERVFRAVLREARLPEKSWKKQADERERSADIATVLALRPSRLLSRPRKIEVTREKIFLKQKTYTIVSWSKVERISADWLESPEFRATARNYYQVEISEGPPLWIYEDEKHEYYLHGWYE